MRPVVLAKLMDGYTTVMVTGTHGKTTTTSMIVVALQRSGFDPSFAVGGDLGQAGTNAHHGSGTTFVAEADESDGSLLEYSPDVAVVTNVEADHLDFFGTEAAYAAVFDEFVTRLRPGGALVVCVDDPGAAALAARSAERGVRVLRYGTGDDANLAGALLDWEQQGTGGVATIRLPGLPHGHGLRLAVPGRHMALNALAAAVAAVEVGADANAVLDGLAGFEGTRRRFEAVGTAAGDGRSIAVFQPHLYSRTQTFAREFGEALSCADEVFVLDVYAAREQPIAGISGASVAEHVSVPTRYVPDFSAVADLVAGSARPGDVVVTMGAGDVTLLGREILAAVQARASRDAPGARSS
jgi:UDP-N-acetylmuramate--alanine ligase